MMLLYIRLINKRWHLPKSSEVPHQSTSKKSEVDLEQVDNPNFRKVKNTENIRNIQQVYYLERRLFV